YPVVASQKFDLLQLLLEQTDFKSVIIFSRTRMGADRIAHRLQAKGHTVGVMHSDRSQRERIEALDGFKSGKFEVLVATDIAGRGQPRAGNSRRVPIPLTALNGFGRVPSSCLAKECAAGAGREYCYRLRRNFFQRR